jgi:hypothetical protein
MADFPGSENDWEFEPGIGSGNGQLQWPGAMKGFFPEEFDRTDGLGGGLTGQLLFLLEKNEVLPNLVGRKVCGISLKIFAELTDIIVISLAGSVGKGQKTQVVSKAVERRKNRLFLYSY